MIENLVRQDEWNAMKDWAVPQSKLSANKERHNYVSNVVYRQTNKMGRFDFGTFWLGTFWLWDVLTWDVLTLGRFDLGHFDFGTFWLGTFWLRDKKCSLSRVWSNIVKIYLGRFDSPKLGRFGKSLGTFWFWDVLTGYRMTILFFKLANHQIRHQDTIEWAVSLVTAYGHKCCLDKCCLVSIRIFSIMNNILLLWSS